MYKIMIIEDDVCIKEELSILLQNNGYAVYIPKTFESILSEIKDEEPHLIILDINLPVTDGFKLCMQIRAFSKVPIIFVTSRNTDMDELHSITLGGDDFITKPYHCAILLARISSLLKRTYQGEINNTSLLHKDVLLDLATSTVTYQGKQCELTKNELKILHYLFLNKGKITSRLDIIDYLWDNHMFIDDNALSVNMTRIREKLLSIGISNFIITKRGQGYIL